jgi:hypothetical protein
LTAARAEDPSTFTFPDFITHEFIITHRFTWSTVTSTSQGKCRLAETPTRTSVGAIFTSSTITGVDHNSLANIQGGDGIDEYYHLTLDERERLVQHLKRVAGEDLKAGQPVYVASDGWVYKATANSDAASRVCGLCKADKSVGYYTNIVFGGGLELSDWTLVTGGVNLTPGAIYYLDTTAGQLTVNAPTVGYSLQAAIAISTTELTINLQKRILL